jgi:hypothetical protein
VDPVSRELDRLEQKIDRLKREYDLFLAGKRRGEPLSLRGEVEKEILRLTRSPLSSTAIRFRTRTLAHRFQAVEAQVRNLVEFRISRRRTPQPEPEDGAAVLLDRVAVDNPESVANQLERIEKAIAEAAGGLASPPFAVIREKLFEEARRYVERPDVLGVRFSVIEKDGRAKIRGKIVVSAPESSEEPRPAAPEEGAQP